MYNPLADRLRNLFEGRSLAIGGLLLALILAACGGQSDRLSNAAVLVIGAVDEPTLMQGATVTGTVTVELVSDEPIESVAFYVDDREGEGEPFATLTEQPFSFDLDSTALEDGRHVLVAQVDHARDGGSAPQEIVIQFLVVNDPSDEEPEPEPQPEPVPTPDPEDPKPPVPPTPPSDPTDPKPEDVLWYADHESGDLSQWGERGGKWCGGPANNGGARTEASTSFSKSGNHSMRLTISDVHSDQGARMFRICESEGRDELYYGVWMYFPETFVPTGGWWNVFQYKSNNGRVNDPFFIVNVRNVGDNMSFYLYDWQERVTYNQSKLTIPVGEWVHLEARYKSSGGENGSISVWQDGVLLFDVAGVRTRYADGDTQWSVNNYASSIRPDPATIYMDDATISRVRVGPDTDLATLNGVKPAEWAGR